MKGLKYLFSPIFKAQQKDGIESLIYLMRDKKTDDRAKEDAAGTLESITSMDFGDDVAKWGNWFDKKYGKSKR